MSPQWQVGIDIGGTFTDVIARQPLTGEVRAAKVTTRIDDRVKGLVLALKAVSLGWNQVADLILGTTMVTNAIVEDDLADVALITTEGFGDTLAIGRQNRKHLYRLDLPSKTPSQIPPELRFEVHERLDHDGNVLTPLDVGSITDILAKIKASGVKSVAVSLLHSYANPAHESALGQILKADFPYVALSHQINPEAREFERTATTALSASLMPLAAGQIDRMEAIKPAGSRLHLFHSAGGMAAPSVLRDLPLGLAMSGPAAGVAAAGHIARKLEIVKVLSFDMGGTTTDVCLIVDGKAMVSSSRSLGDRPIRQPMVAVESIGAGGGSIARLDHGALLVGPQSAGAFPGPACYGKGGQNPTVSDANLVLGYLDGDRVLGDNLALDTEAAGTAIQPLAKEMGLGIEDAALGIVRVANSAMVRALRRITVEQGIDGRDCTLMAFGGAGPMHAVEVAREFGISKVIVPQFSSMFSALGCISAKMSYTRQRTLRMASGAWDNKRLRQIRDELRDGLSQHMAKPMKAAGMGVQDLLVTEVALIRYRGQSYAIEVPNPDFAA
ncbi:MAG: hydantoinase/oxoprolinase family protein, partial [Alphaproteobacteria bacterium]|nr:hydantoinase/oxoprolinase family protein [Alphaproteobacteria bacterium]